MKKLLILATLFMVAACAPVATTPSFDPLTLRQSLAAIPGAEVSPGDPINLAFPGQTLYAEGAVLPLPGGPQVLDPLATALNQWPQLQWTGQVRAETGEGEGYDLALAEKRLELLLIYLEGKGLETAKIKLEASITEGAPLELTLTNEGQ